MKDGRVEEENRKIPFREICLCTARGFAHDRIVMMSSFRTLMACAASFCLLVPLSAGQAPPFGNSLTWDTGKESPSLERLRGKSVMILFFQDWCGICNGWSGDLFKQLGEAYGNDPTVALIAIKSDGGTIGDAHDYMKSRTELRHWMVAVDENATYYRQATGQTKLYHYLWIAPDGSIAETGKAGSFYGDEKNKRFVMAAAETRPKIRKNSAALMRFDPPLSEDLQAAVRLAENGLFLSALGEVNKSSGTASLSGDVARFRERIASLLQASVDHHRTVLQDGKASTATSPTLPCAASGGTSELRSPVLAARESVAAQSRSGWVAAEEKAETEYQSIMRRAARADDAQAKARIARALEKLADSYPDTVYGKIAAASPADSKE